MRKKCKKQYIGIFIFLIILLCVVFLTLGVKAGNEKKDGNTTYDIFYTTEKPQPGMTKKDYQKKDLERAMQEVIQLIVEDSDPVVSISNYHFTDHSETTVSVILHTKDTNDVSEEQKEGIERFISGCFNEIPQDNIVIKVNEK